MTLGGGVNITREPRNGRTFEYWVRIRFWRAHWSGSLIKCEQAQHVIGDIKHYAVNDQESGRNEVDVDHRRSGRCGKAICWRLRLAWASAQPGAVMCSYNSVNGDFACENKYMLTDVLKKEWGFTRIRGVRLGRHAQHGEGFGGGTGQ